MLLNVTRRKRCARGVQSSKGIAAIAPATTPSSSATHTTSALAVFPSRCSARVERALGELAVSRVAVVHATRALVQQRHDRRRVGGLKAAHAGAFGVGHGAPSYGAGARRLAPMSRFSEPQDPLFQALNSSIGVRLPPGALRPRAVARPRADARPLRGSSTPTTSLRSSVGLAQVARRGRGGPLRDQGRTTRTCTWRSSGA